MRKKEYRDFESAKKFVQSLNLKNQKAWTGYCKSGDKPYDIPVHPERVYRNDWIGLGDWLGTKQISNQEKHKKFLSYDDASKICIKLRIQTGNEYVRKFGQNNFPDELPSSPPSTYKKVWKKKGSWSGFLKTGNVSNQDRVFLSYNQAKKAVQKVIQNGKSLGSGTDFGNWSKSGNRPKNIPSAPDRTYKKEGTWKGWGSFLGTGTIAAKDRKYRPFKEAKKFVRFLKLKNQKDWFNFSKSKKIPIDIPTRPDTIYANDGWIGYPDWIGVDTLPSRGRIYRPFKEARKFVRSLKLKNQQEWKDFYKSKKRPIDIPTRPDTVYANDGWIGLGDWLGTGNRANRYAKFLPFKEAREFVRKLNLKSVSEWNNYVKSGKLPQDIPKGPGLTYKNKGWNGYSDWLGTGTIPSQVKSKNYLLWPEAKKEYERLAKEYKIRNYSDWKKFRIKNRKLLEKLHLPELPWIVYTKARVWMKEFQDD